MHIAQPNAQLSPGCTWHIPDLASGIAAPFVVQSEVEHSPSPHGHKAGHTEVRHNATLRSIKLDHGTSPNLGTHYNSWPERGKKKQVIMEGLFYGPWITLLHPTYTKTTEMSSLRDRLMIKLSKLTTGHYQTRL